MNAQERIGRIICSLNDNDRKPTVYLATAEAILSAVGHAEMVQALRDTRGFIAHWFEDVAAGLKPTRASLEALKAKVEAAISKAVGA